MQLLLEQLFDDLGLVEEEDREDGDIVNTVLPEIFAEQNFRGCSQVLY